MMIDVSQTILPVLISVGGAALTVWKGIEVLRERVQHEREARERDIATLRNELQRLEADHGDYRRDQAAREIRMTDALEAIRADIAAINTTIAGIVSRRRRGDV